MICNLFVTSKIEFSNSPMDYVRDGDIQGRSLVFLKAHCPCMDVNWVSFCDLVSVGVVPIKKKKNSVRSDFTKFD